MISIKDAGSVDLFYQSPIAPGPSVPTKFTWQGKILYAILMAFMSLLIFSACCYSYRLARRNRRVNSIAATATTTNDRSRLHPEVLSSLPVFVYSSMALGGELECAVCLVEFKDGDGCRLLPRCYHSFHAECVDLWFGSHSTCPLCRATVESENPETAV